MDTLRVSQSALDAYIKFADGMKYPTEQFNRDITALEYLAIERPGYFQKLVEAVRVDEGVVSSDDLANVISSFGWTRGKRLSKEIAGLIDRVAVSSRITANGPTTLRLQSPFAHVHPETRLSPAPQSPAIRQTVTLSVHG